MGKIITFIQTNNGQFSSTSLEALAAGRQLSAELGHTHTAVVFGREEPPGPVAGADIDEILMVPAEELATYTPLRYVAAMDAVLQAESPDLLLAGHTYQARDWLPRLACRQGRPLVSDCVGFSFAGELTWERQVFQGKLHAEVQTTPGLTIVSFQTGAFSADDLGTGAPAVRNMPIDLASVTPHVRPGEPYEEARRTVDLSKAERIVAIGRGIGDKANLAQFEALAEALGAEVGSSRPVIDYGWLSRDRQIGSSGQIVSPKLYLAVGISGAIQHQVGMKNSGCVVAINKDPNAPIFEIADYGIVADLMEIAPRLTEAIKAHSSG